MMLSAHDFTQIRNNIIDIEELLIAADNNYISFQDIPNTPIVINNISKPGNLIIKQITERYMQHGFAIVELTSAPATPEILVSLGDALDLGELFTPPLYKSGDYTAAHISTISTPLDTDLVHPTFESTAGLELHCDGTLQEIGYVKTSILLCQFPGAEGGETTLFNASGAFVELIKNDLAAAIALMNPGVLIRQANMNNCRDINAGPAFTVQNKQIVCAYSVTKTDKLVAAHGVNEADLLRGAKFLQQVATAGSIYFTQVRLNVNQAIILANTKVCHGRTPYRNGIGHHRCLYRGLYLAEPKMVNEDPRFFENAKSSTKPSVLSIN